MPPSKRNRVIPTSKTRKDRKALTRRLHTNIQDAASTYGSIWVFGVQNVRNTFLKDVRTQLADSRIFMGKTKLMLHALGSTAETELLPGLAGLSGYMSGEVGLLFTDRAEGEVERYFGGLAPLDYARAGAVASSGFTIPRGELTTRYGVEGGVDDALPMAMEPTLRKLGVPTRIVRGKVVLEESGVDGMDQEEGYVVCREGDVLDSRQTAILKIFGARMAEFRIVLRAVYDKTSEKVRQVCEMEVD
jgi:mRNA turnover protein 4